VSQPVDMDLTGLSAFPGGAGWKAGEGGGGNASAMWGASNVAPSTGDCFRLIRLLFEALQTFNGSLLYISSSC